MIGFSFTVNSAGPCDNRPGVIGRRLSITLGGMVPVASSSQFNVSGVIHFVQPFCIALSTTIPYQFSFVIIIQIVTCVHLMDNSVTVI